MYDQESAANSLKGKNKTIQDQLYMKPLNVRNKPELMTKESQIVQLQTACWSACNRSSGQEVLSE